MELRKKKLTEIIGLLASKDLRRLKDFLSSPYHVKSGDRNVFLKLVDHFLKYSKDSVSDQLDERVLFSVLFPNKEFVAGKIDKKISELTDVVFDFIGLEQVKKGKSIELGALKYLRGKGVDKLYQKGINKIKRRFEKDKTRTIDNDLIHFEIQLEHCRFMNMDPFKNNQASYDMVYGALNDLYVNHFIFLGLRNMAYNNFVKTNEIRSNFDALLFLLDARDTKALTASQVFEEDVFRIVLDAASVSKERIEKLANQLDAIIDDIGLESYKNYRTVIRSFTVVQSNAGDHSLDPVLFQMYKSEVEKGYIFFESKISSAVVNNIVISALRVKEMGWLNDFLNGIEGKILEPDLEKFTIALNRGKLYFAQGKFEEVLEILIFEVKEVYLKIYVRMLELRAYYELRSEQLPYKIEAYKLFIYRLPETKVGSDFIKGHNNFIRLLRSICHSSTAHDLKRIDRLNQKILDTKILAEKPWLLEKVAALRSAKQ